MRTIKLFAVMGLAVALIAVPVLTQQPQPKVVNVTCDAQNNIIKVSLNPVVLVIAAKDTARWVFDASVGTCKVKDKKLDPNGQALKDLGLNKIEIAVVRAGLINLAPNPVGWPGTQQQPSAITGTPAAAGTTEYSIKFLKDGDLLIEIKEASKLEILVSTPTLTEWGLIALAVLLAGGMGYMIYRRRPALRPAAP